MLLVAADKLVKRYGQTLALDGVSFEVNQGEIVGLLGPNGAGKTTTMRILAGFMSATSGRAFIAGHNVFSDSLVARQKIGYMPEGVPLYPEMRVTEYLAYRARIKSVPKHERKQTVGHAMERCDLAGVERKLIANLSKGYRQRVGLADALLNDPPVLILDEPTLGLDPIQIRQVRKLIRDIATDRTVILSTHILREVERVCNRVIIIHEGKLVFRDTLSEIARHGARGTRVIVEARDPASIAGELRRIEGVIDLHCEDMGSFVRLELQLDPDAEIREQVFALAVQNHWTLRELRREQPSLEDIFVTLTTRESA